MNLRISLFAFDNLGWAGLDFANTFHSLAAFPGGRYFVMEFVTRIGANLPGDLRGRAGGRTDEGQSRAALVTYVRKSRPA